MTMRFSVVTPSYNQGRFIERTIQSVLAQDVDIDYLVVDGGSTDQTLDILRRYGDRIRWISESDRGPSQAINKGFAMTSGEVLAWLNADDVYYPGALAAVAACFAAHPETQVIYGDADHIDAADRHIEAYPTRDYDWHALTTQCFISQPATFLRRETYLRFGPLEESIRSMDYEYWLRLGKAGTIFQHLPRALAATRLHPEAFTVAHREQGHAEVNRITRYHLGRTPDIWLYNWAHAAIEARGFSRERPLRFALAVSLVSLYGALRWNWRISLDMLRTTVRWSGGNLWLACRRLLQGQT